MDVVWDQFYFSLPCGSQSLSLLHIFLYISYCWSRRRACCSNRLERKGMRDWLPILVGLVRLTDCNSLLSKIQILNYIATLTKKNQKKSHYGFYSISGIVLKD